MTAAATQTAALVNSIRLLADEVGGAARADLDGQLLALKVASDGLKSRLTAAADDALALVAGLAEFTARLNARFCAAAYALTPAAPPPLTDTPHDGDDEVDAQWRHHCEQQAAPPAPEPTTPPAAVTPPMPDEQAAQGPKHSPLNEAEAQAAYDAAEPVPLSQERVNEIVDYATGTAACPPVDAPQEPAAAVPAKKARKGRRS